MSQATLSVVLPNYNHARFIGEALEMILGQSFRPKELFVVDDGSTDDSVDVIERFVRRDSIVRLVRHEENQGVVAALNTGLKLSSGTHVYWPAADDKLIPGLFEKSMALLARFPRAAFCCSDFMIQDERGKGSILRDVRLNLSPTARYFSPTELIGVMKTRNFQLATQTTIMRRDALEQAGGFIPELGWQMDWFPEFAAGFRRGFCYIPEPLAIARLTPSNNSTLQARKRTSQRAILEHMLGLLASERFRDVREAFRTTAVLSRFKWEAVSVLRKKPHREFLTARLLARALWLELKFFLIPLTPEKLKALARRFYPRSVLFPMETAR